MSKDGERNKGLEVTISNLGDAVVASVKKRFRIEPGIVMFLLDEHGFVHCTTNLHEENYNAFVKQMAAETAKGAHFYDADNVTVKGTKH